MQLVLLGPPGSGKGTLAVDLIRLYHLPYISTGDIFRKNIKEKTPLGNQAAQYLSSGGLVPDEVTIAMVADYLAQPACAVGFMLDGFPRTINQAEALTAILETMNKPLSKVINLDASQETILVRLAGRRVCSKCSRVYNVNTMPSKIEGVCDTCGGQVIQRNDDHVETVLNRLETYRLQTEPLIEYYSKLGVLVTIDSNKSIEQILPAVTALLDPLKAQE